MANYLDRDRYNMYNDSDKHGPGPGLMGADTLLGNDVVNGQEESLGDIKEFMIDMSTGHIAYAVLAFGGFLGMGEKLFAVPFQALQLDTANHRFTLNVPKERLQDAPGFDKDAWPDMTNVEWSEHIHEFYGTEPHSTHSGGVGMSGGLSPGAGAGSMGARQSGSGSLQSDGGMSSSRSGSVGSGSGSMGSGGSGSLGSGSGSLGGSSSQSGGGLGSSQSSKPGALGGSVLGDSGDVSGGGSISSGRGLELGRDGELNPGTGSITDSNYQEKQ